MSNREKLFKALELISEVEQSLVVSWNSAQKKITQVMVDV